MLIRVCRPGMGAHAKRSRPRLACPAPTSACRRTDRRAAVGRSGTVRRIVAAARLRAARCDRRGVRPADQRCAGKCWIGPGGGCARSAQSLGLVVEPTGRRSHRLPTGAQPERFRSTARVWRRHSNDLGGKRRHVVHRWLHHPSIFNSYMASAGHRANILGANFRYVGVGTVSANSACAGNDYNTMTFTDKVDAGSSPSRPARASPFAPGRTTGWWWRKAPVLEH